MVTISKPVGRGRNGDEDMMGKDSGLLIALVCDRTLQSIIPLQISSSFFTKSAEEPHLPSIRKSLSFTRWCQTLRMLGFTDHHKKDGILPQVASLWYYNSVTINPL